MPNSTVPVTPFDATNPNLCRELNCDYLISLPNGSQPTRSLLFRGANYLPLDLSINGQATATVQAESTAPALLKHTLTWLPDEFSATAFAAGRQVQSAACVMANAPTTTASVAFSGVTNSAGVVQGAISAQNLHVPSTMFARSGTCTLSVVNFRKETVVPRITTRPAPLSLAVAFSIWPGLVMT